MKSIRIFLISAILSTITLITFLSALNGYRDSLAKAEQLFDQDLMNKAYLLSSAFTYATDSYATENRLKKDQPMEQAVMQKHNSVHTIEPVFAFQIWKQNLLLLRSFNAAAIPIADFTTGFNYKNTNNYRWRTFTYYNEKADIWVITAERVDIRYILAENIVLETILPAVFMLPLIAFLIWFIVRYGLSPLRQLVMALGNKRADDLSPLPLEQQPGELIQLVTSINDLLHRLKTSFLREKRFASDAAHELRTPISAIKIHLHNLSCSIAHSDEDHNMQQLTLSVKRMEHLVEQILNLNRISPEQYMANFKELDLYQLAQELIVREYAQLSNKNLQIELEGKHCYINGDEFSLDVLLQNLLSNACKYTPEGGSILLSISCNKDNNNNRRVVLEIQNTGCGVPDEQYERLFDRFYRSNGDRHDSGSSGCGLGLAIVKQIAELHQANIAIDSAQFSSDPKNKGFMVSITFRADLNKQSTL